ncbi:Mu transposase C-terminal domain-containing protein [Fusobacterium sp.]|uniref:Mu transposase C-terminal domain-containing protein n=1 Tax=Fusobacterium sp. TaxID=68766 RepID=UPI002901C0AC|nr:Mu transposase C-terminal domain-containing protein [Fusobacterium sp.]MDU1911354.1 Mu transposase C-terminal domain-containing protein [Fusobacterium sp.]
MKTSKSFLRFNNFIYTNNFLTSLKGKKIIVKYNPLDTDILYLFFKNQFLELLILQQAKKILSLFLYLIS